MNKQTKSGLVVAILGVAMAIGAPLGVWLSQGGTATAATAATAENAPETVRAAEQRSEAPRRAEQQTIVVDEITITAPKPIRKSAQPARTNKPCKMHDEGTRDLVQGSGTVRITTFCH